MTQMTQMTQVILVYLKYSVAHGIPRHPTAEAWDQRRPGAVELRRDALQGLLLLRQLHAQVTARLDVTKGNAENHRDI